MNRTEDLIDPVITGVDRKVPDLIVQQSMELMIGVEGQSMLGEGEAGVLAAVNDDFIRGRSSVVRDADSSGAVGDDPFSVVHRSAGTGRIDGPCRSAVFAGADINIQ